MGAFLSRVWQEIAHLMGWQVLLPHGTTQNVVYNQPHGTTGDAISTDAAMEDAPSVSKIPQSEGASLRRRVKKTPEREVTDVVLEPPSPMKSNWEESAEHPKPQLDVVPPTKKSKNDEMKKEPNAPSVEEMKFENVPNVNFGTAECPESLSPDYASAPNGFHNNLNGHAAGTPPERPRLPMSCKAEPQAEITRNTASKKKIDEGSRTQKSSSGAGDFDLDPTVRIDNKISDKSLDSHGKDNAKGDGMDQSPKPKECVAMDEDHAVSLSDSAACDRKSSQEKEIENVSSEEIMIDHSEAFEDGKRQVEAAEQSSCGEITDSAKADCRKTPQSEATEQDIRGKTTVAQDELSQQKMDKEGTPGQAELEIEVPQENRVNEQETENERMIQGNNTSIQSEVDTGVSPSSPAQDVTEEQDMDVEEDGEKDKVAKSTLADSGEQEKYQSSAPSGVSDHSEPNRKLVDYTSSDTDQDGFEVKEKQDKMPDCEQQKLEEGAGSDMELEEVDLVKSHVSHNFGAAKIDEDADLASTSTTSDMELTGELQDTGSLDKVEDSAGENKETPDFETEDDAKISQNFTQKLPYETADEISQRQNVRNCELDVENSSRDVKNIDQKSPFKSTDEKHEPQPRIMKDKNGEMVNLEGTENGRKSPESDVENIKEIQKSPCKTPPTKQVSVQWSGNANEVFITGSWVNWSERVRLDKSEGNVWTADVELHENIKEIELKFIVDGVWLTSPDMPSVDDGSGNRNNIIRIMH